MGDLTFRLATAGDTDTLQRIRRDAFAPVFAGFADQTGPEIAAVAFASANAEQASQLAALFDPAPDSELWVAEREGVPIGFAAIAFHRARHVGEIGLNAVDPAHAGQGVGTRLYIHALARMRAEGMRVAEVGTGGDAAHAPARRAYAKAGFGPAIPSVALYQRVD